MDVNSNINSGKLIPAQPKAAPKVEVQLPLPQPASPAAPIVAPKIELPSNSEAQRYAKVKAAAEVVKNTYAVSDTRFTIFKDSTGDYVTKFTSLRDGTVKYFPEKTLFELTQARNAKFDAYQATLDTSA